MLRWIDHIAGRIVYSRLAYCGVLYYGMIGPMPIMFVRPAFRWFDIREPGALDRALADVDQRTGR